MNALVIGATGAVGKDLVDQLLKDDAFERVTVFVRRPLLTRRTIAAVAPMTRAFMALKPV